MKFPMLTPLEALRFIAFWVVFCLLATLAVGGFLILTGWVL